ncbi:hypothetical protein BH10PSE6_BH10PSE6_04640 [soil metagenome]
MPDMTSAEDPSARELDLLMTVRDLRKALRETLEYIRDELEPNPPANIAGFSALLKEGSPNTEARDNVCDFAALLKETGRSMTLAAAMPAFEEAGNGMLEWIVLTTISGEPPGLTERQISHLSGASNKRTRRLLRELTESGAISGSSGSYALTAKGAGIIDAIAQQLLPILRNFLVKNPYGLVNAVRVVSSLARLQDTTNKIERRAGRNQRTED